MWSNSAPQDAMCRRPKSLHREICSRADSAASAMCGRSHASNSQPCFVVACLLFPGPHLWCFDANVPCGRASAQLVCHAGASLPSEQNQCKRVKGHVHGSMATTQRLSQRLALNADFQALHRELRAQFRRYDWALLSICIVIAC